MGLKMISREKAVEVLLRLIDSGVLKKAIKRDLERIIVCIECEEDGESLWEDDAGTSCKLFT